MPSSPGNISRGRIYLNDITAGGPGTMLLEDLGGFKHKSGWIASDLRSVEVFGLGLRTDCSISTIGGKRQCRCSR
jgi:hypothetical protein